MSEANNCGHKGRRANEHCWWCCNRLHGKEDAYLCAGFRGETVETEEQQQ